MAVRPEAPVQTLPGLTQAVLDAPELLKLFYIGRPALTIDAYERDLAAFAAFTGAPSVEHAVHALLHLQKPAADALAHEWGATMQGAPATRVRRMSALRGLVKMAQRFGSITWQLDVKDPLVEKFRDTEGPGLDALGGLLQAADELSGQRKLRARVVLLLIVTLGLRRDEVAKLRIGGFDAQRKRFYVIGKNQREAFVTVPDMLAEAIVEWLQVLKHREQSDFLIQRLDKPGTGVTGQSIYKIIAMLGQRAGIHTWPHGLRHTSVTEVTRVDGLLTANKFARHKDVKTTMIYQDRIENLAGVGARTMERLLKESWTREKSSLCWEALREGLRTRNVDVASACSFCWYCGREENNLVIEHMVPRSRGGSDEADNLAVACRSCNALKSSLTVREFRRKAFQDLPKNTFAGELAGLMTEPPDPPPEPPDENPFDPENNASSGIGL